MRRSGSIHSVAGPSKFQRPLMMRLLVSLRFKALDRKDALAEIKERRFSIASISTVPRHGGLRHGSQSMYLRVS